MGNTPKFLTFEYKIRFEIRNKTYKIIHYNSPWDNERELEDLRIMFDGKDLEGNDCSVYQVIKWRTLENKKYDAVVQMNLYQRKPNSPHEQVFALKSLIASENE